MSEPVNDSFTIHTPAGSLFFHGVGGGACFVLLEWQGKNMTMLLDPAHVEDLGKFLHFVQGRARASEREAEREHEHVTETRALPPAPPANNGAGRPFGVGFDGEEIDYAEYARLYCLDEAEDYYSTRLHCGGRMAYVADHFKLTMTTASGRINKAAEMGILIRRRGKLPRFAPPYVRNGSS